MVSKTPPSAFCFLLMVQRGMAMTRARMRVDTRVHTERVGHSAIPLRRDCGSAFLNHGMLEPPAATTSKRMVTLGGNP